MTSKRDICVSIVSHRHGHMLPMLLADLAKLCAERFSVVITLNVPEKLLFQPEAYSFPIKIIENKTPQGFAENHNKALAGVEADYYCVLNPDVRFPHDPFPVLLEILQQKNVGLVAPRIINNDQKVEDSARKFPTLSRIFKRYFAKSEKLDYPVTAEIFSPDWVAGMFMLFRRSSFEKIGGFDERYFLYVEDADICYRLKQAGFQLLYVPQTVVIHNAARSSHKNLRFLWWHSTSLLRFFRKYYLSARSHA